MTISWRWLWVLAAALALSACGGGGADAGASPFGSGGGNGGNGPDPGAPQAADLALVLSSFTLPNTGSGKVTATATAVDANRNAIGGIPITISVDSEAVAAVSGSTTDAKGEVTADVSIGQNASNRVITVTAKSGSLVRTASFQVTGATLTATAVPAIATPGSAGNQIQYRLVNASGNPMGGQTVTVTAPGMPTATGTTGTNGEFNFTYTAPASPGTLSVVATAAGATKTQDVLVQSVGSVGAPCANRSGSCELNPTVASASIRSDKNVVGVNSTGTNNRVELRVLFLTVDNAPIKNMRVRFDLDGDANSIGGSLTSGSNIVYSDDSGEAITAYVPGSRSSPTDGVTIRACYSTADFADAVPSNPNVDCPSGLPAVRARLTVAGEPLSVSIGTDNLIQTDSARKTFVKEYVVMVVDAAGNAQPDVQITPSVDLPSYYKGFYTWNGKRWVQNMTLSSTESYSWNAGSRAWARGAATLQPSCPQEDVNRNGSREAGPWNIGDSQDEVARPLSTREEDLNWNGSLDARKADAAISVVGSSKTDSRGTVVVRLEYPQDRASWVDYVITVTASGIGGSEGRALYTGTLYGLGNLPYPADAVTDENVAPAFVISPYGRGTVCTNTD